MQSSDPQSVVGNQEVGHGPGPYQTLGHIAAEVRRILGAVGEELRVLRRLHEVATERTVGLAAVIEQAKATIGPVPHLDQTIPQVEQIRTVLASADTDAALREVRAKAWDEANEAASKWWHKGGLSEPYPRNPYREGMKADRCTRESIEYVLDQVFGA